MSPIQIPHEWPDDGLITFEEFCTPIRTQRAVRGSRQRHVGPGWERFDGYSWLYITVAEVRRFLCCATTARREVRIDG